MTGKLMAAAGLALCAAMASAEPVTVAGVVTDPDGQPVAGAQVWVVTEEWDEEGRYRSGVLAGETATGADGRFEVAGVEWPSPRLPHRAPMAVALAEGFALAWDGADTPGAEVRLRLERPAPVTGSLRDAQGNGIAGARVTVARAWHVTEEGYARDYLYLPEALAEALACVTDDQGEFVVDRLPAAASVGIRVAAPGYREFSVNGKPGEPIEVTLGEAGSLAGRLVCEEPAGAAERQVRVMAGELPLAGALDCSLSETVTTDAEGRFAADGLPPGEYTVSVVCRGDDTWHSLEQAAAVLDPGRRAEDLSISLKRARPVSGRVLNARSGEPVPGVRVYAYTEAGGYSVSTIADAEGRYRLNALPGLMSIYAGPVEGYLYWEPAVPVNVAEEGETVKDLELTPIGRLVVSVVNEEGRPQPEARVHLKNNTEDRAYRWQTTGPNGEAEYRNIALGSEVTLLASTASAVATAPVTATIGEDERVEVVVSEGRAAGVYGRVVDDLGRPVEGAPIWLQFRLALAGEGAEASSLTASGASTKTGADGRFEVGGLFPNARYTLTVELEDAATPGELTWTSAPGLDHDIGELVVVMGRAKVAGVVVDQAGQPVAGARVFNRGDGPAPTETASDAEGRFELAGMFAGPVYVFAEAEGYRFSGLRTDTGRDDVRITLTSTDEPRPDRPCNPPALTREREKELVREVVLEGVEVTRGLGLRARQQIVAPLGAVDPELAQRLWEELGLGEETQLARFLILGLAEQDPNAAIDWAWELEEVNMRGMVLMMLAMTLAEREPDLAAQAYDLAATVARGMDPANPGVMLLSRIARGLMELGRGGWEAIAREAAELARGIDPDNWACAEARGEAAAALAPADLEAALALLADIPPRQGHYGGSGLTGIAIALAGRDPAKAEEILAQGPYGGRVGSLAHVAWEMAGADLERALAFARRETSNTEGGFALACLGLRIADEDSARAWALIDEGTAVLVASAGRQRGSHLAPHAARIAWVALQAGYPDMQGMIMRVMALRGDAKAPGTEGPDPQGYGWPLGTAALLGLVDAPTTRELLAPVAEEIGELPRSQDSYAVVIKLMEAAALADAAWALEVVRAMPDDPPGTEAPFKAWAHTTLAETLAQEPRWRLYDIGHSWLPGAVWW